MLAAVLNFDTMPNKDPRRRAADAEDIINDRVRTGLPPEDPALEADMKSSLARMVDMRIPLWQVLVALTVGGFTLISMWFSVQQLTESMRKVQTTLEAGSTQTQAFREELAVQKFRLTTIDAEIAALKAARYQDAK